MVDTMEIKVLKDEAKELIIEFDSKDITLPDLLVNELLEDSDVSFAGVSKEHPDVGKPILVIKTVKGGATKALDGAIERIRDNVKELKAGLAKKTR